jgi:hypothetical protein
MADVEKASRKVEFTNPTMHAGWYGTRPGFPGIPVFVVFTLEDAKKLFEEDHKQGKVIALCVAPPLAVYARSAEQAVHFFSDVIPTIEF